MLPRFRRFLRNSSVKQRKSSVNSTRSVNDEEEGGIGGAKEERKARNSLLLEQSLRSQETCEENLHFIVDYLGSSQVSEVQSISLLLESVKRVKKACSQATRVDFVIKDGILKVSSVEIHGLILTVPLYIVALCAQESLRSFDKCFGINITRKNSHLCYVFQAGSSLEASSIVRSVAISFKSLGKMLRERKEKMRQTRRRMKTTLYKQNSVGSDWSSQSGFLNDSLDPWQQFDTCSRVSSATSRGSEQPRQSSLSNRHFSMTHSTISNKRTSSSHLLAFKHSEFTPLSPVPSNNSSIEHNESISLKSERWKMNAEKRKGDFQIEVDVHCNLSQKLGRVEQTEQSSSIVQESFNEMTEDSSIVQDTPSQSFCTAKEDIDDRFETVLSAIQRGDLTSLSECLDDGIDIDMADTTRRSLLFHAVNYGQIGAVHLLLERGATVNWEGPNDMSPLHQAAANRDKSIAQVLLAAGANVRAKDCEFRTPLHMCAGHASGTELSCILVEHGARIYDNSIDGTRPLDLLPDLRELQSRLVQSVCEMFLASDPSKSRSNSATSMHSYQSNTQHSVMSAASPVHHFNSLRSIYNQSPQMRHTRQANKRFAANFDLGSFQWKKDTKYATDDHVTGLSEAKVIPGHQDNQSNGCVRIEEDHVDNPCQSSDIITGPSSLTERVVAEHQGGSFVIGSVNTWNTRDNTQGILLSSTPADQSLLSDRQHLISDVTTRGPHSRTTGASSDSGVRIQSDENVNTCHSILHHTNDHSRAKLRGESVRFQDTSLETNDTKNMDSAINDYSNISEHVLEQNKEFLDKCRERTRSNADSCYSSIATHEEDPALLSLGSLLQLSFNPECQPLLLSYLCLPKAGKRLTMLAQSPVYDSSVPTAVAALINNLASIEGPDSRRRAAEAGFIRTVLILAETQEPVQTTCLEVLDSLIKDVKCEKEYNTTMTNIPSGPLLALLNYQHHPTEHPPKQNDDIEVESLKTTCVADIERCNCKKCLENNLSPRLVATRLLAASSSHLKMQRELGTTSAITLLVDALNEKNEEVVYNAVVTIANIAMYYDNHELLIETSAVENLKNKIQNNSRAYYHVCRALVYLNEEDEHCDYLFDFDEEDRRVLYDDSSTNEEAYIKGGSLETLVRMLTTNALTLWGGVPLLSPSLPSRAQKRSRQKSKMNEHHVIEFFLATYSTFTNAVVLMRLLIHRFHDPSLSVLFNEETGRFSEESDCLPPLHMSLMRIWSTWLKTFAGDFKNTVLQEEVRHLIQTLASYDGPYIICADHLQDLLTHYNEVSYSPVPSPDHCHHDTLFKTCQQAVVSNTLPTRLDDAIYLAALQLYIEISSLKDQSSTSSKMFSTDQNDMDKISTSRIKFCLHPSYHKEKNIHKRIRTYYDQIARDCPSQRNAKHDYVDCCQGMVAYGCKFFKVKESSCCNKSHLSKRLIGINANQVVLMEAKTRNVLRKWDLNSLLGWRCDSNNTSLVLLFSESSSHLVCDSKETLEQLRDIIKQCVYERNCEDINEDDFLPWSKRSEEKGNWGRAAMEDEINHRLKHLSKTTSIFQNQDEWNSFNHSYSNTRHTETRTRRHSSPNKQQHHRTKHNSNAEFEDDHTSTIAFSVGTLDQRDPSRDNAVTRYNTTINNSSSLPRTTTGHNTSQQSYLENTMTIYLDEKTHESSTSQMMPDDEVMNVTRLRMCHCPPDAELTAFNRSNFTLHQLLRFPRELARQITLIDHELFRRITNADILKRVNEGTAKKRKKNNDDKEQQTTMKLFSDRFNQLSSWVVSSLLKEETHESTAEMIINFIETAKQCLELRNYNAMMAIGVGALCSAPVRRLREARALIPKWYLDQLHIMEVLMDSRENHKKYRESLKVCPSPAVPYFGVYLKDLIYISEGNADYLNGGMINLGKRRLLHIILHQIRRFQIKSYNFEQVTEIKDYLLNTERYTEEELHRMSRRLDTSSRNTASDASISISGVSIA